MKCSNGAKFTISCSAKQTVAELKTALEEQAGVPASQMRLIYRGQIMKDEKTLDTYCTFFLPLAIPSCCHAGFHFSALSQCSRLPRVSMRWGSFLSETPSS